MAIKRICAYPGCTTLVLKGRCEKHSAAKYGFQGGEKANRDFYKSAAWRRLRKQVLDGAPLCQIQHYCTGDPATEVDHITPIEAGGDRLDPDNLQSACKRCHSHKTFYVDMPLIRQLKETRREQEDSKGHNR